MVGEPKGVFREAARASFMAFGDVVANVRVEGHSLEVDGRIGDAFFTTRHGTLSLSIVIGTPAAIVAAAVGRPLGDVFDHRALRDLPWRVARASEIDGFSVSILIETRAIPCDILLRHGSLMSR